MKHTIFAFKAVHPSVFATAHPATLHQTQVVWTQNLCVGTLTLLVADNQPAQETICGFFGWTMRGS